MSKARTLLSLLLLVLLAVGGGCSTSGISDKGSLDSDAFEIDDWRNTEYMFYFLVENAPGIGKERLISELKKTTFSYRSDCGIAPWISGFPLRDFADTLIVIAEDNLPRELLLDLKTDLENGRIDLAQVGVVPAFPSPDSILSELLDWWISACGDDARPEPSNTTSPPPNDQAPNMPAGGTSRPRTGGNNCADYFRGGAFLSMMSVDFGCDWTYSNCRLQKEEEVYESGALVKRYSFFADINFNDGSTYGGYYFSRETRNWCS